MVDDKNIKFRAVIDAADFDRGMSDIQRKMRAIQQEMGRMQTTQRAVTSDPVVGKFAREFFQKNQQNTGQQLMQDIQKQRQEIQGTRAKVEEKKKELDILKEEMKLKKEAGELDKQSEKNLQRKIELTEKLMNNYVRMGASQSTDLGYMTQTAQAAGLMQAPQGPASPWNQRSGNYRSFRQLGFGRNMAAGLSMFGGAAAVGGSILAGAATAGYIGADVINERAERQRRVSMAMGSAGRSGSTELQRELSGRGIENEIFAEERARAFQMSEQEMRGRRLRDVTTSRSGLAMIGGGLMVGAGALMSATGVGAAAGVPLMMAGGATMTGGGIGMLGNRQNRQALFNSPEYRARLVQEEMANARQMEEAERLRDPSKYFGTQYLMKNRSLFRGYQQTFGEGRAELPGGMISAFNAQGLTGKTALPLAQQIQQASGTTLGMGDAGDVRTAYLLQQGGLTNAGKAMGVMRGISQRFGGEGNTEDSFKNLFAEAVKMGVDESNMVQELRDFTSAAVKMADASGMSLEEAARELAAGGVGGAGARSLRGAQTAIEMERGLGTARGAGLMFKLGYAQSSNFEGQEAFNKLTTSQQMAFATMDPTKFTENNPELMGMLDKMDIDIETARRYKSMMDMAGGVKRGSTIKKMTDMMDELRGKSPEEVQQWMSKNRGRYSEVMSEARMGSEIFAGADFEGMQAYIKKSATVRGGGFGQKITPETSEAALTPEEKRQRRRARGDIFADTALAGALDYNEDAGVLSPEYRKKAPTDLFSQITARGAGTTEAAFEKREALGEGALMEMAGQHVDKIRQAADNFEKGTNTFFQAIGVLKTLLQEGKITEEQFQSIAGDAASSLGSRNYVEQPTPKANTEAPFVLPGGKF